MGIANTINFNFNFKTELGDILTFIEILVNVSFGVWILRTVQTKLNNERVLKDHFINEFKGIRDEYGLLFKSLYSGQTKPKDIPRWFKHMNIQIDDLLKILNTKYKIKTDVLNDFQNTLRDSITNNQDYIINYRSNTLIRFSPRSIRDFENFQLTNNHLFNDIIILINDYS